jgi:hypothetical protein
VRTSPGRRWKARAAAGTLPCVIDALIDRMPLLLLLAVLALAAHVAIVELADPARLVAAVPAAVVAVVYLRAGGRRRPDGDGDGDAGRGS